MVPQLMLGLSTRREQSLPAWWPPRQEHSETLTHGRCFEIKTGLVYIAKVHKIDKSLFTFWTDSMNVSWWI